jgi:hypothetical protein
MAAMILKSQIANETRTRNQTYQERPTTTIGILSDIIAIMIMIEPLAGERLHKDIYEALRAGKNWQKTLFLIMCTCTQPQPQPLRLP